MKPLKLGGKMLEIPMTTETKGPMATVIYNNCVKCGARWNILEHFGIEDVHFDEIDIRNLEKTGQLYSNCEDCDEHGQCESVEYGEKR